MAISHVAAIAKTKPISSRRCGSFLADKHAYSMTNTMPMHCSTVAVPAFVYSTTIVYVI